MEGSVYEAEYTTQRKMGGKTWAEIIKQISNLCYPVPV